MMPDTLPRFKSSIGYGVITLAGLLAIIFLTLYPFHFEQFERIYNLTEYVGGFYIRSYHTCCKHLTVLEPLANVFLFIPFGFGLTGIFNVLSKSRLKIFFLAFLLSACLSSLVEILQVFQPLRTPSLTDLFMNSTGGCLGFAAYLFFDALKNRFFHH